MLALVLSGVLVTMQHGNELARETWRDDGKVVTSAIAALGKKAELTIDRQTRALRIVQDGKTFDVPVPAGAAPLPNLDWAAYGLLADWFKDARKPTPFTAVLGPGVSRPATVLVTPAADGGRTVTVTLGAITVEAEVDARGAVTHAAVPAQNLEVKPIAAGAARVHRPAPAGVDETQLEIDHAGARLACVLWRPKGKAQDKLPLVIVIPGSGPTDHDGNQGKALDSDVYRQLAEALARQGIATLRYDKRGIGASTLGKPIDQLTFGDGVDDVVALVAWARQQPKLGKVVLFGHSEGSLVALEVAARTHVDGIVSAAGAGRPVHEVVREQLARQLSAAELREYDALMPEVRAGHVVHPKSPALASLLVPMYAKFLPGMLFTDPRPLARAYTGPLTVVQGDNDKQITVDKDARPLAAAHPGARLAILHDVTHVLKIDKTKALPQPSYHDPSLPLAPGVVDAVVSTVK